MINKVILLGRLGRDPEYKSFGNKGGVGNFAIATSSNYKDKEGNWVEQTEWHEVKQFGAGGQRNAENLKKGDIVFVEGSITTEEYTNKDGVEIKKKLIKAEKLVKG